MLVTDAVATTLTKLGAPRHAETTRSGDIPEHWPKQRLCSKRAISIHVYGTDVTRVGSSVRRYYL